jgi:hypothetical protein
LQGATVDHLYALLGDPMTSKELAYVQASRHRHGLHLYATEAMAGEQLTRIAKREQTRTIEQQHEPLQSPLEPLMSESQKQPLAHDFVPDEVLHPEIPKPPLEQEPDFDDLL